MKLGKWTDTARNALSLAVFSPREFWNRLITRLLPSKSGEIVLDGIRFQIDIDLDPSMKAMYHRVYEVKVVSLLRKYLREGDIFVDVGANLGYISARALGLVGKTGEVHAFEPVPRFYERLQMVQQSNPDYHLYTNSTALGESEALATIAVTNLRNIGWNTMVPGYMRQDTIAEEIEIPITRLDSYLFDKGIANVRLIKIDTEGYELPVVKGVRQYLRNSTQLPVFIIEVAPTAYPYLDASPRDIFELMSAFGYEAYSADLSGRVDVLSLKVTTNVVFLPRSEQSKVSHRMADHRC